MGDDGFTAPPALLQSAASLLESGKADIDKQARFAQTHRGGFEDADAAQQMNLNAGARLEDAARLVGSKSPEGKQLMASAKRVRDLSPETAAGAQRIRTLYDSALRNLRQTAGPAGSAPPAALQDPGEVSRAQMGLVKDRLQAIHDETGLAIEADQRGVGGGDLERAPDALRSLSEELGPEHPMATLLSAELRRIDAAGEGGVLATARAVRAASGRLTAQAETQLRSSPGGWQASSATAAQPGLSAQGQRANLRLFRETVRDIADLPLQKNDLEAQVEMKHSTAAVYVVASYDPEDLSSISGRLTTLATQLGPSDPLAPLVQDESARLVQADPEGQYIDAKARVQSMVARLQDAASALEKTLPPALKPMPFRP